MRPFAYAINNENIEEVSQLVENQINKEYIGKKFKSFAELSKKFELVINTKNISKLIHLTEQPREKTDIISAQESRVAKLKAQYSMYNAHFATFVSPVWTLEYALLLSPLGERLSKIMIESMYAKQNQSEWLSFYENRYQQNPNEAAQWLYKKFESSGSKTIIAQKLAESITVLEEDERKKLSSKLEKFTYCSYLIDAIKFASGITGGE